jgi:hypothetical protein
VADETATEPEEVDHGDAEISASPSQEDNGSGVTLEGVNDKVDSLIAKVEAFLKGGTTSKARTTKADEAAGVAEQVRTEVGKLKAEEKREAARTGRLDQLEAAVKKLAEKAPVEYRRITTMLWGDPDD